MLCRPSINLNGIYNQSLLSTINLCFRSAFFPHESSSCFFPQLLPPPFATIAEGINGQNTINSQKTNNRQKRDHENSPRTPSKSGDPETRRSLESGDSHRMNRTHCRRILAGERPEVEAESERHKKSRQNTSIRASPEEKKRIIVRKGVKSSMMRRVGEERAAERRRRPAEKIQSQERRDRKTRARRRGIGIGEKGRRTHDEELE